MPEQVEESIDLLNVARRMHGMERAHAIAQRGESSSTAPMYQIIKGYGTAKTIFDFPELILDKIFSYFTYDELAKIRGVSRIFNCYVKEELNKGFEKLGKILETNKQNVKKGLPKRESQRKRHRLTKINEIYTAMDTRYSLLDLTFKKYMTHTHPRLNICFIPGRVIDEFNRVLDILQKCIDNGGEFTGDVTELLKEVRDLSSMAMEYFEETILPILDERAEREGISSYVYDSITTYSKKKPWRVRRDPHELGLPPNAQYDRIVANSPLAKDLPKSMQDKIEAQQKKIDSQTEEIRLLKDAVSSLFTFMQQSFPEHRSRLRRFMVDSPLLLLRVPRRINLHPIKMKLDHRNHESECSMISAMNH
ncbi:unnamed protein product [Caenorhabditis bovis]|uniref:F-box domain-containing protein n=1 Tax=Caenorhabditis bovis TaxID=2654633 RepID=A0A8S1ERN0_9PELO|nr:unnamed protein product [Caenorhabditis bovis]